jgi:hypothetical protein
MEVWFMEYAAPLTRFPSRQSIVAPLVALVVGAGVATGAYALIDDGNTATDSQVIVVQRPGPHAADIAGKNEAATAAAIGRPTTLTAEHPNEAATAASISSEQSGIQPRGSKASETGTTAGATSDRAQELRQDPHGAAVSLRGE